MRLLQRGRQWPVWRDKTRLFSSDVRAAATSKVWRDSGRASFSPLHPMRLCWQGVEKLQSWTKGLGKVMQYSRFLSFFVVVIKKCYLLENIPYIVNTPNNSGDTRSTSLVGWGEGLATCDSKKASWKGYLQLVVRVVQNRYTGKQEMPGTRQKKEILILNDISSLFVLSQYVPCSPA